MTAQEEINFLLLQAAADGSFHTTVYLVRAGADVNTRDYLESTPLHLAASRNHASIVRYLLDHGADVTIQDAFGNTPIDLAVKGNNDHIVTMLRKSTNTNSKSRIHRATWANDLAPLTPDQPSITSSVCLLFAEIDGYQCLRCQMDPCLLIDLLSHLFQALDALAEMHDVQVIDTFDGCYIASTAALSHPHDDHALRIARFALAACQVASGMIAHDATGAKPLRLRVGLHCGDVATAVIGARGELKRTMVGDAVNVASRMQSQGRAGATQCSEAMADLLRAQAEAAAGKDWSGGEAGLLQLEPRQGVLEVKGRGQMKTFWLSWAERLT